MLPSSHSTNLYDKMLTNCNITPSNDSVISCDNLFTAFWCLLEVTKKILDKKIEARILSTSFCGF